MSSLDVNGWVPGDPSDISNADHVRVEVGLENSCATCRRSPNTGKLLPLLIIVVQPSLNLSVLLQVLSVSIHLSQDSSDSVVLDAQLLDPLLIVCTGLVAHWHVFELGFLGEINVVHRSNARTPSRSSKPKLTIGSDLYSRPTIEIAAMASYLPLSLELGLFCNHVTGTGLFLHKL